MKRYLMAIAGGILLLFALTFVAPMASAHANTTGTISGSVVNATHHNSPVAGQKVTLQRSGAGGAVQDVATTETGRDGHFNFDGVSGNATDSFAIYTQYNGGMFASQTISLDSATATSLQLKVYDTTNDDASLRVSVATLLVRQPRAVNGLIGIGEIVTIQNTGTTAFVGTLTGDASKPMRLLRFATPPNASNLALGIGFDGSQVVTTDKGFGSTATVPPGTTDFAFSIDIPYTGTAGDLSFRSLYPAARVVTLAPLNMFVDGQDFAADGVVNSLGSRYQVFTVTNLAAGKQASLRLTGLPEAGETRYLDTRALTILAAVLALLALAALLLYLRRGNIAVALGLIPGEKLASDASTPQRATTATEIEASERQRLLNEMLELERFHAAGTLSDAAFRQQHQEVRQHLRELMAGELLAVPSKANARNVSGNAQPIGADSKQPDGVTSEEATSEQSSGGRR